MTPEQLVQLAQRFTRAHPARIRNFAALVAAAAASQAKVDGIPVHSTNSQRIAALRDTLVALKPLSAHNVEFAHYCARVLASLLADR